MDQKNGTLEDWGKWKNTLGSLVNIGEGVGLSQELIDGAAHKIGDFLTSFVEPRNREEALLKSLWQEADDKEQKVLAKLIVRLVDKTPDNQ